MREIAVIFFAVLALGLVAALTLAHDAKPATPQRRHCPKTQLIGYAGPSHGYLPPELVYRGWNARP